MGGEVVAFAAVGGDVVEFPFDLVGLSFAPDGLPVAVAVSAGGLWWSH